VNATTPIDVPRLIRIASVACAILAGALVYLRFEPDLDATRAQIDDARDELRSEDVVFADVPRLRSERAALRERYARLFLQNPEAVFLRDLDAAVRRHGVEVVSSRAGRATQAPVTTTAPPQIPLTLELRGSYRDLLATIVDLSRGDEIVEVDAPSLRRDGDALIASVPVAVFEPLGHT
jgi:Tfp pilus assembly protein PilO